MSMPQERKFTNPYPKWEKKVCISLQSNVTCEMYVKDPAQKHRCSRRLRCTNEIKGHVTLPISDHHPNRSSIKCMDYS